MTTTYEWISTASPPRLSPHSHKPAIAGGVFGDRYLAGWDDTGDHDIHGRVTSSEGVPYGGSGGFLVNSGIPNIQNGLSVAGLTDGRFVATFTDYSADPGGDIRARLFNADGSAPAGDFALQVATTDDSQSDVAVLADGGYVVSWTRDFGGGNNDVRAQVYNSNGSLRGGLVPVNNDPNASTTFSSVAALSANGPTHGGFVAVWEQSGLAGGGTDVYFRRFDANGNGLDGSNGTGVLIDNVGGINRDIQVAGLPDGGFVVAYTDNGWGISGTEITAGVFNADGSARGPLHLVNSVDNGGLTFGDQNLPTLTVLANGYFVVGWRGDFHPFSLQVYDPNGIAVGTNQEIHSFGVTQGEIAALSGSRIAVVLDESGSAISPPQLRTQLVEFTRVLTGGDAGEMIVGVGDMLPERLIGRGGNDTLEGKAGSDSLFGDSGFDYASYSSAPTGVVANLANPNANTGDAAGDTYDHIEGLIGSAFADTLTGDAAYNVLDGGAGDDSAVFSHNFNDYTVRDFGAQIMVVGPDGTDVLISIEHLKFADATITPADIANDGNPLFDTLYYLSRNADVFHAGVTALDHFNANGWHEGRNPNAFFSVSQYLGANPDVKASGMNPLEHYDQVGWHQGRDPSTNFDTRLYLVHNPDVAAAGIDPLVHYLANGIAEGRQAYAAIGTAVNGFDAEYYLMRNPDVAAAGADPLAHYNADGWHEGRKPNAWFDTKGYLIHYADVAAAGMNPLTHYEQFGWQEGRDPSAGFDTLKYLAANPDVAAVHINPLDHFINNGIYEGRMAINDGLWH